VHITFWLGSPVGIDNMYDSNNFILLAPNSSMHEATSSPASVNS
jgi:hypothetical protein